MRKFIYSIIMFLAMIFSIMHMWDIRHELFSIEVKEKPAEEITKLTKGRVNERVYYIDMTVVNTNRTTDLNFDVLVIYLCGMMLATIVAGIAIHNAGSAMLSGFIVSIVCLFAMTMLAIKPYNKIVIDTMNVELNLNGKIKNTKDTANYFVENNNKINYVELANKADFYSITKGWGKYKKIDNAVFNNTVRKVYAKYSKYVDMSNFDVRRDSLRKKHEELNDAYFQKLKKENKISIFSTNNIIMIKKVAKEVKAEYNTLMKQEEEKFDTKQLKDAAKSGGKNILKKINEWLLKLNDALDPIFGEN